MKRGTLIIYLLLITTPIFAQESLSNDKKNVQQAMISLFKALSGLDSIELRNSSFPDVIFYEYGEAWPMDTLINKVFLSVAGKDFKRTDTLHFINTTINGNTAWTTYNLHSDIILNDKHVHIHWLETSILVKDKNRWKLKVLHSSLIKRS